MEAAEDVVAAVVPPPPLVDLAATDVEEDVAVGSAAELPRLDGLEEEEEDWFSMPTDRCEYTAQHSARGEGRGG